MYQSYERYYKEPFGAVAAGESLRFRVELPRSLGCRALRLCTRTDDEERFMHQPLEWECMRGEEKESWICFVIPEHPALCWYYFALSTDFGERVLLRGADNAAVLSDALQEPGEGDCWQLTVYDACCQAPQWLYGGVYYQIFPDRFFASGKPKAEVPPERILRGDWGEEPLWEPDRDGKVTQYDFFGGDLCGITEKLSYLADLGVTCLYLTPIFFAQSNHRYDTADYLRIDPLLGNEDDFTQLCEQAERRGIRILLDGVFSHTGDDSVYFNRRNRFPAKGAYQSRESSYYSWYRFRSWPEDYACWWNVAILPELRKEEPAVLDFFTGEQGVVRRWLQRGASGWRLDVADELPDVFLDALHGAAKAEKADAMILGEVWEDASNKISYGNRRRYLLGGQLDSVMNYPFRNAILHFVISGEAERFFPLVLSVLEHYPPGTIHTLLNPLGTHDTVRVLTELGGVAPDPVARRSPPLTAPQREHALRLLRLAAVLQYCLPGNPCVYYGDEAGLEGGADPFNRGCYPWGEEDEALLMFYRSLGGLRKEHTVLRDGVFTHLSAAQGCIAFARESEDERLLLLCNRNPHPISYHLPTRWQSAAPVAPFTREQIQGGAIIVGAEDFVILEG